MKKTVGLVVLAAALLSGCMSEDKQTGQACLGANNDSLVESLGGQCQAGDAIATKHPAYFCDFNYAVAYNDYNSAFCIYSGAQKEERVKAK